MPSNPEPITLANPLLVQRRTLGLTLEDMARRTGIDQGTLSRIERGLVPSLDHSQRIARALVDAARETPPDGVA